MNVPPCPFQFPFHSQSPIHETGVRGPAAQEEMEADPPAGDYLTASVLRSLTRRRVVCSAARSGGLERDTHVRASIVSWRADLWAGQPG